MTGITSLTSGDGWFAVVETNKNIGAQQRFFYAEVILWGASQTEGVIGLIWNGAMQLQSPNADGNIFRAYVRGEEPARAYAERLELEHRSGA